MNVVSNTPFLRDGSCLPSDARVFAASANQVRYVLAELSKTGSYMISVGHMVVGPFDERAFHHAAQVLVARHDALRTRFHFDEGRVSAIVSADATPRIQQCRLLDDRLSAFRTWALPLIFEDVDPLADGSLIRFLVADYGARWRFTIAAHHAITDGFSRGTMNSELLKLYAGETLTEAQSYYTFAQGCPAKGVCSDAVRRLVDDLPKPAQLVRDGVADTADAAGRFVKHSFAGRARQIRTVSKAIGTTKFGFLTAVYALALSRFSMGDDVSTFFQTEGRKALGAPKSVIGPFSNTLPLNARFDPNQGFADVARTQAETTTRTVAFEGEPILDATIAAGKAPGVSINMFPPAGRVRAGNLEIGPREFLDRRTEYDLNLVWSDDQGEVNARAFYNAANLSEDRVTLFVAFLARILDAALTNPDRTCREILSDARRGHESRVTRPKSVPRLQSRLHEAFFAFADTSRDATAVMTSEDTITYGALADRALDVVGSLQTKGVTTSDRVALFAGRDASLVAAMLGVSASGASFAILDATYPPPRLRAMLEQLDIRFVIEAGAECPSDIDLPLERIEIVKGARTRAQIVNGPPRETAYHLFTSGSAGQPKPKTHPDQTIQRYLAWQAEMLELDQPITTLMLAGVSHDPTPRDILLPLSHGGKIAIPRPCEMKDPEALRRLLVQAHCNALRLSPTTSRLLSTGIASDVTFDALRGIFWGGERLPYTVVDQWHDLAPHARQVHVFGTTETSQAFLKHEITADELRFRHVPLGHTLPWTGVRIVDEHGTPVAFGEIGEISAALADPVGGVDDKFPEEDAAPNRQHFTGDMGYMTPDRRVWFIGRRDGQIKINDFRVEPGEIEVAAEVMPGIDRAILVFTGEHLRLFALTQRADLSEKSIRLFLAKSVPSHMVPARVVLIDSIPTTPNGKVDKDALLALPLGDESRDDAEDIEPPKGAAETAIAAVFCKNSGRPAKDRHQSLFDLGADSLATIEARMELEAIGLDLPDDWQWMTISELAKAMPDVAQGERVAHPLLERTRVEVDVFIRALAILAIVATHTGWALIGDASIVLFALAGYAFARLQLPAILKDDHSGRVWALLGRLLVPLIPMSLFYVSFTADLRFETDFEGQWSSLLFFRNLDDLISAVFFGLDIESKNLVWLWFLHVYLQMFLVIGLLLAIPKVRQVLATDAWRSLAVLLAITLVISMSALWSLSAYLGSVAQASRLLETSPTTILPFLILGALAVYAETPLRRVLSLAFALLQLAVVRTYFPEKGELWWILTLAVCWLVPYITLPRIVANTVVMVAAFSLMIYLIHPAIGVAIRVFIGEGGVITPISIGIQVAAGIAVGFASRPVFDRIGLLKLAQRRVTF